VTSFWRATDEYIAEMWSQGRFTSKATEVAYRTTLNRIAQEVSNRDPRYVNRDELKAVLRHWPHPNTRATCRSHMVSFFDWLVEEGIRADNPARQTSRPKRRKPQKYRMTKDEIVRFLGAAETTRERWVTRLGVCAGLRRKELLGLQGRHFSRPGWVWVSSDIAKRGVERWVPLLPELVPVAEEIKAEVALDEYVLPAQRWRDPGRNRERVEMSRVPSSPQALYYLVKRVGKRAGIAGDIGPHTMRHAFCDSLSRYVGPRNAQFLMGHADIATTEMYMGTPTLDELAQAVRGFSFRPEESDRVFYPPATSPANPVVGLTQLEPVEKAFRPPEPVLAEWLTEIAPKVALYRKHFVALQGS
jgi:integrase/recombinase XerD